MSESKHNSYAGFWTVGTGTWTNSKLKIEIEISDQNINKNSAWISPCEFFTWYFPVYTGNIMHWNWARKQLQRYTQQNHESPYTSTGSTLALVLLFLASSSLRSSSACIASESLSSSAVWSAGGLYSSPELSSSSEIMTLRRFGLVFSLDDGEVRRLELCRQ